MAILPIGFFMPLPLAMMIPFMGIQSAVMMKQAGENWQYGKRLQSAMTNDEFNKQTFASIYQKNVANTKEIIPDMKQAIQDMREFQDFIIVEIIELMRRGLETGLGAIFGLTPEQSNQFFGGTTGPPLLDDTTTVNPPNAGKQKLTLSQISAANDQVLLSWITNINDYDAQTQQFLINERQRRQQTTSPAKPSIPQQTTKLNPEFVGSLTQKDLSIGGARVRNYKGTIQKWFGNAKVTRPYPNKTSGHVRYEWISNKWLNVSASQSNTLAQTIFKINNQWKLQYQSSYILEFGAGINRQYYFIKDNF